VDFTGTTSVCATVYFCGKGPDGEVLDRVLTMTKKELHDLEQGQGEPSRTQWGWDKQRGTHKHPDFVVKVRGAEFADEVGKMDLPEEERTRLPLFDGWMPITDFMIIVRPRTDTRSWKNGR